MTTIEAPSSISSDFRIEFAAEEDTGTIFDLIRELAHYQKMPGAVMATEDALRQTLFGPQPAAEVLLARRGTDVVGMAIFFMTYSSMLGKRSIYLDDLYVREQWRGKGVGRALLSRVAHTAGERDCCRVEWMVLDWNESAIRFYESTGAHLMREWTKCRLHEDAILKFSGRD